MVERVAKRHTNETAFRLIAAVYRDSKEPKVRNRVAHCLASFDLSFLGSEFGVAAIAEMAMAAFAHSSSFNPHTGQLESWYNPTTRQVEDIPPKTRLGWERVAAVVHSTLAAEALRQRYDWNGSAVEGLLLGMGTSCIPLLLQRIDSRPRRIDPTNEAPAYWRTALTVIGKMGGPEHLTNVEQLATAVGEASPKIRDACDSAIASIKSRA